MLRQEGIPAMVRQNDALRGRFQTAPMPFSTEVLVKATDLERARELSSRTGATPLSEAAAVPWV